MNDDLIDSEIEVPPASALEEDPDWNRFVALAFFEGYAESDAIYDFDI